MGEKHELEAVKGIGPAIASKLSAENVDTIPKLAGLDDAEIDRLDVKLGLMGHIRTQDWIGQARELMEGIVAPQIKPPKPAPRDDNAELRAQLQSLQEQNAQLMARLSGGASGVVPTITSAPAVEPKRHRRRLNTNRHYSQVFGDHAGAAFMQVIDGKDVYFTHDRVEMFDGEEAPDVDSSEAIPERKTNDPEDVHFINWLDKKADYPFDLLRSAIKKRWPNQNIDTEKAAHTFLHEQLRQNTI